MTGEGIASDPRMYLHWSQAGGPNECEHGYAEGIPCPKCDANPRIIELRAEVADANAEVEQLQAVLEKILDSAFSLDAYIPPYLVDAIKDALRDADNTD